MIFHMELESIDHFIADQYKYVVHSKSSYNFWKDSE